MITFLQDGQLHAADVGVGDQLEAGIPRKVFDIAYRSGPFMPYAATRDGKRFVFCSRTARNVGSRR